MGKRQAVFRGDRGIRLALYERVVRRTRRPYEPELLLLRVWRRGQRPTGEEFNGRRGGETEWNGGIDTLPETKRFPYRSPRPDSSWRARRDSRNEDFDQRAPGDGYNQSWASGGVTVVEQPADLRTESPPQSKSAISDDDPDVGDSATRQQRHDLVKWSNKDHDWFVRKLSELGARIP